MIYEKYFMKAFSDELLSDLTICIFTANRNLDLERLVKFLSVTKVKLLILDASYEAKFQFQALNLHYFHVPSMPLQERIKKFAEMAKTKYVLLSPDDDFYALNGLTETIKFLEMNHDYSSAQGLRIRFFDFPIFHWIPDYVNQMTLDFNQEDKTERLFDMGTKMHYIYAVMRRDVLIKITNCFSNVHSMSRNSIIMGELIFNYTLPVLGKHKVLPIFYSARKAHPYEGGDINFGNWIYDESDSGAIAFKNNLVNFYTEYLKVTQPQALSVFQELTKLFVKPKSVPNKKLKNAKKYIRTSFTVTRLRVLRKFTKLKYLHYYKLLFVNKTFCLFLKDVTIIKEYLDNNRISK
jgi:glycosyltransferase domain-containing protein